MAMRSVDSPAASMTQHASHPQRMPLPLFSPASKSINGSSAACPSSALHLDIGLVHGCLACPLWTKHDMINMLLQLAAINKCLAARR